MASVDDLHDEFKWDELRELADELMTDDGTGLYSQKSNTFKSQSQTGSMMEAAPSSISTPSLTSRASTIVDQIYYDTPGKKLVLEWNDPHRYVYIPGMARPERQGSNLYHASGSVQGSISSSIQYRKANMMSGGYTAATSDAFPRYHVQASQRSTQGSSVVVAIPDKTAGGYRVSNLAEPRIGQQQYGQMRTVYNAASNQGVRSTSSGSSSSSSGSSIQVRLMPGGGYGYADGSAAARQQVSVARGGTSNHQTISPSHVIRPASTQAPARTTAPASSSRMLNTDVSKQQQQQQQQPLKEQDGSRRMYVSHEVHC